MKGTETWQTQADEARAALQYAKGVPRKFTTQSIQRAHLSRREASQISRSVRLSQEKERIVRHIGEHQSGFYEPPEQLIAATNNTEVTLLDFMI
jgi:hypothetical protein